MNPCACGHDLEEHIGDDPAFPNPGECQVEGCACIYFEASDDNEGDDSLATEPQEPKHA